ncbi:MAG: hypothetical protein V1739_07710 [Candidatus Omnitrophota bacterium]
MAIDKIKAVHSDDIEQCLANLKILEAVKAGKYSCSICQKKILVQEISCIYPEDKQVKLCCGNSECYEVVIKKRTTRYE